MPKGYHSSEQYAMNVSINTYGHYPRLEPVSQASKTDKNTRQDNCPESSHTETQSHSKAKPANSRKQPQAEIQLLEKLKQIDTQVRQHEMAHIAAGGGYVTSGARFTYKRGPDGKNYVIGGEVSINTAPVPGDPQATIQKMRRIKSAALAPATPSSQDLKVASKAVSAEAKALSDLMALQAKEQAAANGKKIFGNLTTAVNAYEKAKNLPEEDIASFQIAV